MLQNRKVRAGMVKRLSRIPCGRGIVTVMDCLGYKSKMAQIQQRAARILKCSYAYTPWFERQ